MLDILLATTNLGKFHEIESFLKGMPVRVYSLADMNTGSDLRGPEENGSSYEENAYIKARFFCDRFGVLTLGEDSGISVNAFKNELGVKTRRWGAGEHASDQEWIDRFLKEMSVYKGDDRGACFFCVACFIDPDKDKVRYFRGKTGGMITEKLEFPLLKGVPLSSCFIPNGCDRVYAALGDEYKNKISHRGKALVKFKNFLEEYYF